MADGVARTRESHGDSCILATTSSSCSLDRPGQGSPGEDAHQVHRNSAVPRMSLMGLAAFAASAPARAKCLVGGSLPREPAAGFGREYRRGRDGGQAHAGLFDGFQVGVKPHPRRRAGDGDVHLVSRDESLVGRAAARSWRREDDRGQDLVALEHVSTRRDAKVLHRDLAGPLWPCDHAPGVQGDERGNRVGRGR